MISVWSLGSFYPLMRTVPLMPVTWRYCIAGWPDRSSGHLRRTKPRQSVGNSFTPQCAKRRQGRRSGGDGSGLEVGDLPEIVLEPPVEAHVEVVEAAVGLHVRRLRVTGALHMHEPQ